MRRHKSPGFTIAGAHRSEPPTPEPPAARPRRMPAPRKSAIPTLYVTQPGGAEARTAESHPRWVEVEEVIEYKVTKSPKLSRRRGVSPAGSDRATPTFRSKRSPPENPNANNSNNKLVEQAQAPLQGDVSQPLPWEEEEEEEGGSVASGEPRELSSVLAPAGEDGEAPGDAHTVIFEPDDEEEGRVSPGEQQPRRVLTLEDLEDYVPGEGETYGSPGGREPAAETPCEVSVLQREIGGAAVGQPVLLNVGRPAAAPRQRGGGFFSRFREHLSGGVFSSPTERRVPIQVSHAELEVTPSYHSEVQRVEGGGRSFKTKVSTRTYGYMAAGNDLHQGQ